MNFFRRVFGFIARIFYDTFREKLDSDSLSEIVKKQFLEDSKNYIYEHMEESMEFSKRELYFNYIINLINAKGQENPEFLQGIFAEFGVYRGYSINYFSQRLPAITFHGFDSFEGLYDDWKGNRLLKGSFDLKGKMPSVNKNVLLFKGWFDQSLPSYLESHRAPVSFLHIDSDTYESTKYVLDTIGNRIGKGTIVLFDEYFGYRGWRKGEYKAWREYVEQHNVKYRYIAFCYNQKVAVVVE